MRSCLIFWTDFCLVSLSIGFASVEGEYSTFTPVCAVGQVCRADGESLFCGGSVVLGSWGCWAFGGPVWKRGG